MMRSWKTALEALGFSRWRYVKLEHLHCMAFRKLPPSAEQPGITNSSATRQHPTAHPPASRLDAEGRLGSGVLLDSADVAGVASPDMMYIPQDFSDVSAAWGDGSEGGEGVREEFQGAEERQEFFSTADSELPGFVSEESEED